jgi:hypothetical protein
MADLAAREKDALSLHFNVPRALIPVDNMVHSLHE